MRLRLRCTTLAVVGALALGLTASAHAADDGELRHALREAGLAPYWSFKPAEDFRYPEVTTGRAFTLAEFRGRVVLVNVWATWCPPCVKEMPSLQALHEEFNKRGLVLIGINVHDRKSPTAVAQWLTDRNLTFVNVQARDHGPTFPSRFTIPQTFLIDRSSRLLANKSGPADWASAPIKAIIERLLEEPPDAKR